MRNYDLGGLDIYFVEENQLMRQLMRTVLNTLGVGRVRAAMNVDSAIEELSVEPADAIFTDWSPTTSGIELVHRVRQAPDSPNPYMPVIIVSGYSEFRHVVTARDLGADEYLAKPISANLVYCRIRSLIEARRPFIRNEAYFGPDRRRRHIPPDDLERREGALALPPQPDTRAAGRAPAGPQAASIA